MLAMKLGVDLICQSDVNILVGRQLLTQEGKAASWQTMIPNFFSCLQLERAKSYRLTDIFASRRIKELDVCSFYVHVAHSTLFVDFFCTVPLHGSIIQHAVLLTCTHTIGKRCSFAHVLNQLSAKVFLHSH